MNDFQRKCTLNAVHVFPFKTKKCKTSTTKVFTLDGNNKIHPTNVQGRASSTLPRLALAWYECYLSLVYKV